MSFKYTDAVAKIKGWTTGYRKEKAFHGTDDVPFGHVEKAILGALAERADDEGECWPGYTVLCADTYLSQGAVSRGIANLAALGLITTDKAIRSTCTYYLQLDAIAAAANPVSGEKLKVKGKTYTRIKTVGESITCPVCDETIPTDVRGVEHLVEKHGWVRGEENGQVIAIGPDDEDEPKPAFDIEDEDDELEPSYDELASSAAGRGV